MQDRIENFLKENDLTFRSNETDYQVICPFCDDTRYRLGININTGRMQCFNCNFKVGASTLDENLRGLKKSLSSTKTTVKERKKKTETIISSIRPDLHEVFHKSLKKKERLAYKYLRIKRGLSKEAIDHFKLGSRKTFLNSKGEKINTSEYVSIPYIEDGKCVNLKHRQVKVTNKKYKWRREKGGKSSLFNCDVIHDHQYDDIYILESELDCISLWSNGIKNCVSLTIGAKGFKQEWYDYLERFERIFIILDTDEAGQAGARMLSERLGLNRCYNIKLPEGIKDVNDFFWNSKERKQNLTIDSFKDLVKKAKQFEVDHIVHADDMFEETISDMINNTSGFASLTPWHNVNRAIGGGASEGNLVVIAARPKVGKSSLALDWIQYHAKTKGTALMYSCEMNSKIIAKNLVRSVHPSYTSISTITTDMLRETKRLLPLDNMKFFYPTSGDFSLDKVEENITNAVKRYGIKLVIFDNLLFMAREVKEFSDMKDKVGKITQRFKLLAETLKIVFVLVTHPRKVDHNNQLSESDLKESSSIFQDLDHLLLLHRRDLKDNEDELEPELRPIRDIFEVNRSKESELMQIDVRSRFQYAQTVFLHFDTFSGKLYNNTDRYYFLLDVLHSKKKLQSSSQNKKDHDRASKYKK